MVRPVRLAISPGCGVMIDVNAVASDEPIGLAGKRLQAVGVEHERHAAALDERLHERCHLGDRPSPGPTARTSAGTVST